MKQSISWDRLYHFLAGENLLMTDQQKSLLKDYSALIFEWSAKHNLLSSKDLYYITERHILPSLFLCSNINRNTRGRVLDIGSGAGFPGVVLKIIRPDLDVTLIDSARKKYLFLSEINENLNLSCHVVSGRVESWLDDSTGRFDLIVSRAVTTLEQLWRWAGGALEPNGAFYVLKGGDLEDERDRIKQVNVMVSEMAPDKSWCDFSAFLDGKIVVKMEMNNV